MKKTVLIALAALVILSAAFAFMRPLLTRAGKDSQLLVSGNIEAHESLVSFKVPGRIVELAIEEGQWEEEGALLSRLDDEDYRRQVALDDATVKVQQAQLALALAGSRQQEVRAAKQSVLDAEADVKQKRIDYERAEALYQKSAGSRQARDLAETAMTRAEAVLQRMREIYNQTVEGTRKEEIEVARRNVRRGQEQLELSRVRLSYTQLRAPVAGVVLVRQAELGEVVSPGTPVVTMADLKNIWMRGYIAETDLGRVKWGQSAVVRTDSYPGKAYHGRVSFISSEAEFTPKSVETHRERVTLVYRIKVEVENSRHELKPGMPADATIELGPAMGLARSHG